ncbi:MAG: ECF-type sigma factor [Acidobacteriota bacterium]
MGEVTVLLGAVRDGDSAALQKVFELVYPELKALAAARLRVESATVSPTELVHDVLLRLVGSEQLSLADRRHFFACAARAMRMVVIDRVRRAAAEKRGGGVERVTWTENLPLVTPAASSLLDLDRALDDLHAINPRAHEVVHLRFFAGLTAEQTADLLDLSLRTVHREWKKARAFLYTQIAA